MLAAIFSWICGCAGGGQEKFFVYYGSETVPLATLQKYDLAIVEPDNFVMPSVKASRPRLVAYLSLGEVHESRPYFTRLQKAGALVEKNENWEGAWRLDLRSVAWRSVVLDELIPGLLAKGFAGIFLDTIDTASYLESIDAKKYQGSAHALGDFIREIHLRYPKLVILPNNGLSQLLSYADVVGGVVVEDLYSGYDFAEKRYVKTDPVNDTEKQKILDVFHKKYKKPVYVILYAENGDDDNALYGIKKAKERGYTTSISEISLVVPPTGP